MFARDELEAIAALCREHDLLAVTDEVYEHLVFDGEHVPLATLPGMGERTLTISSAGKTFSFTGWKVGWACGPRRARHGRAHGQAVPHLPWRRRSSTRSPRRSRCPTTTSPACASDLHAKRDRLCAGLESAGFEVFRPAGTYFVTADIARRRDDGVAFCSSLPERCGVVAVPNVVFYDDPARGRSLVRFAFCKRDEVIDEAARRLADLRA